MVSGRDFEMFVAGDKVLEKIVRNTEQEEVVLGSHE